MHVKIFTRIAFLTNFFGCIFLHSLKILLANFIPQLNQFIKIMYSHILVYSYIFLMVTKRTPNMVYWANAVFRLPSPSSWVLNLIKESIFKSSFTATFCFIVEYEFARYNWFRNRPMEHEYKQSNNRYYIYT